MKLFYSPTSPFVRKVLVVAHELGLAQRIERIRVVVSPLLPNPGLAGYNPLMKLPTLVTDEGMSLFDSRVICDYLDRDRVLMPAAGAGRWEIGRLQALADGMLEAGVLCREDQHRFGTYRADAWLHGQQRKIVQGLDALEAAASDLAGPVNLGTIAAGVALAWLKFRDVVGEIEPGRPRLRAWQEEFARRPSMLQTRPAEDERSGILK